MESSHDRQPDALAAEVSRHAAAAGTVADLLAAMRRLRVCTGLTYRQLEHRARLRGNHLPHSTVAGALNRKTLPREELLAAFVRACGVPEEDLAGWLSARRRLATMGTATGMDLDRQPDHALTVIASEAAPAPRPNGRTPEPMPVRLSTEHPDPTWEPAASTLEPTALGLEPAVVTSASAVPLEPSAPDVMPEPPATVPPESPRPAGRSVALLPAGDPVRLKPMRWVRYDDLVDLRPFANTPLVEPFDPEPEPPVATHGDGYAGRHRRAPGEPAPAWLIRHDPVPGRHQRPRKPRAGRGPVRRATGRAVASVTPPIIQRRSFPVRVLTGTLAGLLTLVAAGQVAENIRDSARDGGTVTMDIPPNDPGAVEPDTEGATEDSTPDGAAPSEDGSSPPDAPDPDQAKPAPDQAKPAPGQNGGAGDADNHESAPPDRGSGSGRGPTNTEADTDRPSVATDTDRPPAATDTDSSAYDPSTTYDSADTYEAPDPYRPPASSARTATYEYEPPAPEKTVGGGSSYTSEPATTYSAPVTSSSNPTYGSGSGIYVEPSFPAGSSGNVVMVDPVTGEQKQVINT